jgi:hypothetical protein
MSPLTIPRAENEGDALLVVSPLGLHHSTRQRYTSKTSQELVYFHFQLFSLELHTQTLIGAIKCVVSIFSSKSVVYRSMWFAPPSLEKSGPPAIRGTPAFHYGSVLENQESGRGRSTELKFVVLMTVMPAAL